MIKQCKQCKRILEIDDFHYDKNSKDNRRSICKDCARKRALESKHRSKIKYHGLIDVYYNIIKRCYDKDSISYPRYGARGITMCEEWISNRQAFIDWCIENGHKPGLQIDRIDNDKGYSPDNCRFVTRAENQHNTSKTVLTQKDINTIRNNNISRKMTQAELAKQLGVSQSRISEISNNKSWKMQTRHKK